MNKPPSCIWVFNDGRAGTFNSALGVAEALDLPFTIKNISYTRLAKLPNFFRGKTTLGISKETKENLRKDISANGYPNLIITAGRRAAPLARTIKHLSNGTTKLVQIMFPSAIGLSDFDMLVIPKHDNKNLSPKYHNILEIIGTPHRINNQILREASVKWQPEFAHFKRPFTALIVGGSTKNRTFTNEMATDLCIRVNKLLGETNRGTVFITTSRRTGKSQEKILLSKIDEPRYTYIWGDKKENPYFGYLALADRIIVTGDSVSMCSESCSTPVPVYIYDNKDLITPKHRRFLHDLYKEGYAAPLDFAKAEDEAPHLTFNPSKEIAAHIKTLLKD